jgi:C1A family cysteine protease
MAKKTNKNSFGWIPDLPDHRDHLFVANPLILQKLPASADLTKLCPAVYDQGQLGSCTANAIAAALEFEQMKQQLKKFMPSRLFIYYNERVMEHTVHSDSGAMIRDGIKSVNQKGACSEKIWPYNINNFAIAPAKSCYDDASKHLAVSYQRILQTLGQMKGCLAAGYPFVFGFTVYENFESAAVAKSGQANLPEAGEKVVGGHAVMAVGYDDKTQRFIIRNSWGTSWGKKGYFTLPYSYLTDSSLADDFWTIRVVE